MLHPLIRNGWDLLLCRRVIAAAADTSAGRHGERVSTKPWPWCCLHRVCLQILRSHFLYFLPPPFLLQCSVYAMTAEWRAIHWVCARIELKSLPAHSGVCECPSPLSECQHSCVCVMSLASSCHFSCHPPQLRFSALAFGGVGGGGYLGVACGDPSQALAALRLTNGLLLSVCDKPGAGANISSLWHRSGCQQKAWHGINKARSRRKAAKCLEPSIRRWGYERRQLACVATCPAHAQMEDVKSLQMPYLKKTNATAERGRGKEK